MSGYTVIDVETTGLSPEKHDRIVEIGVVYVSGMGEIQDHWSTLVNPHRDVGPTHIHGIRARDVLEAPTFADLAPYVLRSIRGRTIVAHNASFDLRFLAGELVRAGVPLTSLPLVGVCTMSWSSTFVRAGSRRLADCCRACGVSLDNAHSAGNDALATAELLSFYLRAAHLQPPWQSTLEEARRYTWPTYRGDYPELRMWRRTDVTARREDAWLDRIVSRMPRAASPQVEGYLAVLETALVDRHLAEHEKTALVDTAAAVGLTKGQVIDLHGEYLRAMAMVAMGDGVLTEVELADLRYVARSLGLGEPDIDAALDAAVESLAAGLAPASSFEQAGLSLRPGDRSPSPGR